MQTDGTRCRVTTVAPDGTVTAAWLLDGSGRADLSTIDELARLALAASRRGEVLVLRDVAPDLADLIRFAALPVEMER